MTALALDGTSPLDLGAVTEVFGIDRGLAADWYDFSICGQRRGRLGTRGGQGHGAEQANRLGRGPYLPPAASGSAPRSAGRSNIARRTRPSTSSPTRRDGPPDLLQRVPGQHRHHATPLASRAAGAARAPPPRNDPTHDRADRAAF